MPEATGLDLLSQLKREGHDVPVIIVTGYSTIENAVLAIKSGAVDYLTKPLRLETLEIAVSQALEMARLRREHQELKEEVQRLRGGREIVGGSAALTRALAAIEAVAPTRATVLIEGESGTGKELFARLIHQKSPRAAAPFVSINCAAMPEGLVESALFGHEKGAFTGATSRSHGAFERAHGGTLLLDEISEMRSDLQAKLLRAIQEQQFERVGGHTPITVDVRIVATTNRDLKAEVTAGRFREDLYYRLCVVPVFTPPLRERADDVPALARHFARRTAAEIGVNPPDVTPEAIALLQSYPWPGNVRELANLVERAVILARGKALTPEAFDLRLGAPSAPAPPAGDTAIPPDLFDLDQIERVMIARALKKTGGNRTRAAQLLGISERTLRNKLNSPKSAA
jgi:DNA-binding NtrC family response regulator